MGSNKTSNDTYSTNFGNFANTQDFSNLFGGNKVFNLGAGSSNTSVLSSSTDLSSVFKTDLTATNTNKNEAGGIGMDVAASVGVGVGGGSGSAGAVDKTTTTSEIDNSSMSVSAGKGGYTTYLLIGGGVLGLLIVLFLVFRKKKR